MTGSARAHRTARLVAGATLLLSYSGGCAVSEEVEYTIGGLPNASGGTGGTTPVNTGGTITSTGGVTSATGGTRATGGTKATGGAVGTGGRVGSGGTLATGGTKASTGGRSSAKGGASATGGVAAGGKSGASGGSAGKSGGTGGKSGGCDWDACTQQQCATACPTNMGTYCATACDAIITCLKAHPTCGTTADPMCVNRNNGAANVCTTEWESASGPASPPGAPAKTASDYYECACGAGPVGTGGASGTGGAKSTGGATGTGGKAGTGGKGA